MTNCYQSFFLARQSFGCVLTAHIASNEKPSSNAKLKLGTKEKVEPF